MATTRADQAKSARYHHGDLRRALVDAGITLLTETGRWDFSLREVARRADVSHNAPYSHFSDKRDLLAAIAVSGFEALGEQMRSSSNAITDPVEALRAIGGAYVRFGLANSAHYRLMFGDALTVLEEGLPASVVLAANATRAVLRDIIVRGMQGGDLRTIGDVRDAIGSAVLLAWSVVHGLTMLCLDGLAASETTMELPLLVENVLTASMFGLVERADR